MLIFSDRKKLDEKYKEWLVSNEHSFEIKDCSFNVINFLVAENLLDEERVYEFLGINRKLFSADF